jgi:hypothetical protein
MRQSEKRRTYVRLIGQPAAEGKFCRFDGFVHRPLISSRKATGKGTSTGKDCRVNVRVIIGAL